MSNGTRAKRVVLPPKRAGKLSKAAITRAVDKVASELWQEKLGCLQQQAASTADPTQKSALTKQIRKAKTKIEKLGR